MYYRPTRPSPTNGSGSLIAMFAGGAVAGVVAARCLSPGRCRPRWTGWQPSSGPRPRRCPRSNHAHHGHTTHRFLLPGTRPVLTGQ